jgi:hypothetical protein
MDAALDRHPNECPHSEEALLSAPHWSANKVGQDISGATEGLHLREKLCSQNKAKNKTSH